jgi:hypothetical protein
MEVHTLFDGGTSCLIESSTKKVGLTSNDPRILPAVPQKVMIIWCALCQHCAYFVHMCIRASAYHWWPLHAIELCSTHACGMLMQMAWMVKSCLRTRAMHSINAAIELISLSAPNPLLKEDLMAFQCNPIMYQTIQGNHVQKLK